MSRVDFARVDSGTSAYREQYGCNFTSAIPTNIFGPDDNLYVASSAPA
jgi:GDP-L-fucose synthase